MRIAYSFDALIVLKWWVGFVAMRFWFSWYSLLNYDREVVDIGSWEDLVSKSVFPIYVSHWFLVDGIISRGPGRQFEDTHRATSLPLPPPSPPSRHFGLGGMFLRGSHSGFGGLFLQNNHLGLVVCSYRIIIWYWRFVPTEIIIWDWRYGLSEVFGRVLRFVLTG